MKTAIYMENGVKQIVLTPENDWEKLVMNGLVDGQAIVSIHRGQFYKCVGGWVRQGPDTDSVMIALGEIKHNSHPAK